MTYGTDANGVVVGTEQKDSLVGTAGADELHGGGGDDLINARGGADVIDGGAGSDMVSYDNSPGGVVINLVAGTGAGSYAEGDRLSGIENLRGSQADDILRGDSGANLITGERGADTIEGGGGADNLIGGADVDTLDYSGSAGGVAVNLTSGTGSAGDAAGDRVSQFENLVGSGYADQLVGDGADNVISGRSGNDVLYGLAGNDRLIGDAGSDRLVGGLGNDTYVVGDRTDVVVERAGEGFDRVIASRSFALSSSSAIELLVASAANARSHARLDLAGSSAANRIEGNSSANVLDGKGGADTLEGFRGNDTYVMDNARDRVLEVRGGGTDTVSVSVSYKLQPRAEVEVLKAASSHATASLHLTGNEFANLLLGNAGRNHLAGKEGKDQLRGLGGSDTLDGGPGSDVLIGGPGHDTFVFRSPLSAPANIDRITDFRPADDTIALGHAFFPNAGPVGSLDPGGLHFGSSASLASDRIVYDRVTGSLWYDSDGSGAAKAVKFAILSNKPLLSADDFTIV